MKEEEEIYNLLMEYDSSNINKKKEILKLLFGKIKESSNSINNLYNKLLEEEKHLNESIING